MLRIWKIQKSIKMKIKLHEIPQLVVFWNISQPVFVSIFAQCQDHVVVTILYPAFLHFMLYHEHLPISNQYHRESSFILKINAVQ